MKSLIPKIFKWKKRQDQRFLVDDYNLIINDPNAPEEKEIVDLSVRGISFTYVDIGKRLGKTFELEIKIGDTFHLNKIRVRTVSDTQISEIPQKSIKFRRLNARFIKLDATHMWDLRNILKKYGKKI